MQAGLGHKLEDDSLHLDHLKPCMLDLVQQIRALGSRTAPTGRGIDHATQEQAMHLNVARQSARELKC